jgi:hypothetical protein
LPARAFVRPAFSRSDGSPVHVTSDRSPAESDRNAGEAITGRRMDIEPSRFAQEQISGTLREQEAGAKTADVCRKYESAVRLSTNARLSTADCKRPTPSGGKPSSTEIPSSRSSWPRRCGTTPCSRTSSQKSDRVRRPARRGLFCEARSRQESGGHVQFWGGPHLGYGYACVSWPGSAAGSAIAIYLS